MHAETETAARGRMTPEQRRAAVLDATVPLLVEHGAGVTTRQIADAAGVAEGTLFRVFDDKKALIVAAIARALDPEPVVAALTAVDRGRDLDAVLLDLVDVLASRSAGMRSVMAVAHEMRRAAAEREPGGLPTGPPGEPAHDERPGSLHHAVHALRARAGQAPTEIVGALAAALQPHAAHLRSDPAVCARLVFAVVTSSFHDPLGSTGQMSAPEVVEVLLDGLRARPAAAQAPPPSRTTHPGETPC